MTLPSASGIDLVEIAKAMRISYAYFYGETNLVPWDEAMPAKQDAWLACAEAAVDRMLELYDRSGGA